MGPRRLSVDGVSPSATQNSLESKMKLPFQGQQDGQQQHQQHQQHQQRQQHLQLHPQQNHTWLDRGSGELAQDVDLEAGHHPGVPLSNLSHSSLQHSSVAGGDEQDNDDGNEWNSRHPCFPHRNPHVPPDSKEYETTRIIRIGRDYMYSGDLSPAFSYVYPEILEPFVSEVRFREVIKRVNDELYEAHTPWSRANIMEGVVGMLTLWMYEDIVDTKAKRRIENVERYLERVNEELEKEGGAKFIPLRRTGFLKLDIQIPDPGILTTDDESESSDEDQDSDQRQRGMTDEEQRMKKLHFEGLSPIERPPALMVNGQFT